MRILQSVQCLKRQPGLKTNNLGAVFTLTNLLEGTLAARYIFLL